MWETNDKILMVQHDQSWDTKEMRKGIHRRRVRRREKAVLDKCAKMWYNDCEGDDGSYSCNRILDCSNNNK